MSTGDYIPGCIGPGVWRVSDTPAAAFSRCCGPAHACACHMRVAKRQDSFWKEGKGRKEGSKAPKGRKEGSDPMIDYLHHLLWGADLFGHLYYTFAAMLP